MPDQVVQEKNRRAATTEIGWSVNFCIFSRLIDVVQIVEKATLRVSIKLSCLSPIYIRKKKKNHGLLVAQIGQKEGKNIGEGRRD